MTITNYFPAIDRNDLCHLFRQAGALSNLAQVCLLFNEVVTEEAVKFYAALTATYGQGCLGYVLKRIGVHDKSNAAKIDALFSAVLVTGRLLVSYNPHSLNEVKLYMCPYVEAESLCKLWAALIRCAHPSLKSLMTNVKFGDDPLQNAQIVRDFFQAHSKEFAKVENLSLNKRGLRVVPQEIFYCSKLKKLDLSNNVLMVLPEEIGLLKELKDLRLNYNFLESLPEAVGQLTSLENFQCGFNRLTSIPDSLCQLGKLRSLNLSGNKLKMLPEKMDGLQALNYLYLEGNSLSFLPDSIGAISYLIGLYLFNNQIAELPSSLCKMEYLKYLCAQNNNLWALPEDIGGLVALTTLLVDGNQIKELPTSVSALQNLKIFFLSCNQIEELPKEIGDLKKLELILLAGNPIKTNSALLNPAMTEIEFNRIYWGLGDNKWKECIDGFDHSHGPDVYDKGLHGRAVESGFISSMIKAFQFLRAHYNQEIHAEFYLQLHKETCSHFKGKETCTLMGQEKVGVFRDSDDAISAGFSESNYLMTDSAANEFNELNMKISLILGSSFRIGDIVIQSSKTKSRSIYYFPLSREQVKIIFNLFITEFYFDMAHAKDDYKKVQAIAKLIQRLEWLHPVRDGCGRTDTALLNYLLTCFGFNPVLFEFPYVSSCKGLDEWTGLVFKGMEQWRKEAGL